MKKVLFFIFLLAGFAAYAQTAQSVNVDFNKKSVPCVSISVAGYDIKFVTEALQYRFEKVGGLKGSNLKGFRMYAAQRFAEFGSLNYDTYTLVAKGSKKEKNLIINLLVSTGNENFVSQESDPDLTQRMKDFLNNFVPYLKEYEKMKNISQLNATIADLEKTNKALNSDLDKLQKERVKLDKKIEDKNKALNKNNEELRKANAALESLK